MAERPRGMGRGLAAILAASPREEPEELRRVPVEMVTPNPHQPRTNFDEESIASLAGSIGARGVIQPILVRPLAGGRYELIAGERRWRAAQVAGLSEIPAVVRRHDDAASLEMALIENMAREDLNPVEEARACAGLVEELGLSREDVGLRVGRSRVAVSNLIRLLELPDDALELIEQGLLSEGHGRALLLAPDHDERRRLARSAATEAWSVRQLEARARERAGGEDAPPRRSGRRADLHPDAQAAADELRDALEPVFGAPLEVHPSAGGKLRTVIEFDSLEEALAVAARLRRGLEPFDPQAEIAASRIAS